MAAVKKAAVKKAVAKKAAAPEVRHDRFDWRSFYLYAVSLATLMVCLLTTIAIVNSFLDIVMPDPGYYDGGSTPAGMTKEAYRAQLEDDNQRRAIKSLISSTALFASALPLYLYHWRTARKAHN